MKKCELCQRVAKIYCDSDQACLCWDCDTNVHTANFIVEKHLRTLLCQVCQAPTPWNASGPQLAPTLSLCPGCAKNTSTNAQNGDHTDHEYDDSGDDGSDGNDDSDDEDDDDDDDGGGGDNQVVPLGSSLNSVPSPPVSTSSSSNEMSFSVEGISRKRCGI